MDESLTQIIRDQDFSIIMKYFILYGDLKFLLKQICPGLLTVKDGMEWNGIQFARAHAFFAWR